MTQKYNDYINGEEWEQKSKKYLEEHPICEICHKHKSVQVHHNSYENIGYEPEEDLTGMCDRCHYHIHAMPPMIEDPEQLKKAMKLMEDFRNYPRLKTLVLNTVSEKYFSGEFMIELSHREAPRTAFFAQNLMEVFYERGKVIGEDIIEFATQTCYMLKMTAGKNAYTISKDSIKRKEAFENGDLEIVNTYVTTTLRQERTREELMEIVKKQWIFGQIRDKEVLARAKSFANINYYKCSVYFNREGIFTAEQFYLKLKRDGFIESLFVDMGGDQIDFEKEVEKLAESI